MTEAIIVAIITGGFALVGTWLTVKSGNNKIIAEMREHNVLQDEQIKTLTEEVKKHNNFAERVPVIETRFESLERRVTKLEDVERK